MHTCTTACAKYLPSPWPLQLLPTSQVNTPTLIAIFRLGSVESKRVFCIETLTPLMANRGLVSPEGGRKERGSKVAHFLMRCKISPPPPAQFKNLAPRDIVRSEWNGGGTFQALWLNNSHEKVFPVSMKLLKFFNSVCVPHWWLCALHFAI